MLANPTPAPMSRFSHQSYSLWANASQLHSGYSASAPSTSNPSPYNPSFFAQPTSFATGVVKSENQTIPPTAHITPNGTTIYAATGRKRKRLQKACVACHKAKRRCDGGLPCSNCDFSGRTCCYSDPTGKMILPTARISTESSQSPSQIATIQDPNTGHSLLTTQGIIATSSTLPAQRESPVALATMQHAMQNVNPVRMSPSASPKPAGSLASLPLSIAEIPSELRRELISIFFSQLHPFSSVMDEISFLRDLSTSEVSPALLMSMFALSARFQHDVVDQQPRFAAGEVYARSARTLLVEEDSHGLTLLDRPDVDTVMTLSFLAAHELGMGRIQRALSYSSDAVRLVSTLRLHDGLAPSARQPSYHRDSFSGSVRRNTCLRLACLTWILDALVSSLAGQPPSSRAQEIELLFDQIKASADDKTKSFVRLAQVFCVFMRVLDFCRRSRLEQQVGSSPSRTMWLQANEEIRHCKDSLHRWAENLPSDQTFDEANLTATARLLAEADSNPAADRAWCWAMMHTVAECSVFMLHSSHVSDSDQSRQTAAYDNLVLLLESLGPSSRRSVFMIPTMLICTGYPIRPNLQVSRWWSQAREFWGLDERQITEAAQNLSVSRQLASPTHSLPPPLPQQQQAAIKPLPRHHHSMSSTTLPSISTLPLPSLKLSRSMPGHRSPPPLLVSSLSCSPSDTPSIGGSDRGLALKSPGCRSTTPTTAAVELKSPFRTPTSPLVSTGSTSISSVHTQQDAIRSSESKSPTTRSTSLYEHSSPATANEETSYHPTLFPIRAHAHHHHSHYHDQHAKHEAHSQQQHQPLLHSTSPRSATSPNAWNPISSLRVEKRFISGISL